MPSPHDRADPATDETEPGRENRPAGTDTGTNTGASTDAETSAEPDGAAAPAEVPEQTPQTHRTETRPAPLRTGARVDADGFVRIHPPRMILLALLVALLCGSPFIAAAVPWSLLVLLVPLVVGWYVVRTGTVASADGVAVRGPTYSRTVLREDVDGLAVTARNGVVLLRRGGTALLLPAARPRDLPALREVLFGERAASAQ